MERPDTENMDFSTSADKLHDIYQFITFLDLHFPLIYQGILCPESLWLLN